jgi:hypothetical protein
MAKAPRFAKAFAVEMDNWDGDFLNLVEESHLTFRAKSDGEIAFGALKGFSRRPLRRARRFGMRGVPMGRRRRE